jgi:hypothetical protein
MGNIKQRVDDDNLQSCSRGEITANGVLKAVFGCMKPTRAEEIPPLSEIQFNTAILLQHAPTVNPNSFLVEINNTRLQPASNFGIIRVRKDLHKPRTQANIGHQRKKQCL